MKKFFFLFLLVPALSFGSGTLQVKPGFFMKAKKPGGQVGLSIYEPVIGGIKLNQWFGVGFQPRAYEDSVLYAVSDTTFEKWFGNFGFGVGYKFQHASAQSLNLGLISEHSVNVRGSWKLW